MKFPSSRHLALEHAAQSKNRDPNERQDNFLRHQNVLGDSKINCVCHVRQPEGLENFCYVEHQMFIQGVTMMYLMLKANLRNILTGNPIMVTKRKAVMANRTGPQRDMNSRPLSQITHLWKSHNPITK